MMMAAFRGGHCRSSAQGRRKNKKRKLRDQIGRTMVIWPVLDETLTSNGAPRRKAV